MKNIGAGNFIGEMALINGEPRSAATEVSQLPLYAVDFQMLSNSSPEIAETHPQDGAGAAGRAAEGNPSLVAAAWVTH